MALVDYPESFPTEAAAYFVGLVTKKEAPDKELIGHRGWNLVGYLTKVSIGEPEAMHAEPLNLTAENVAAAIEALDPDKPQAVVFGGIGKKLLLTIIMRIIEKAVASGELPSSFDSILDAILGGVFGGE